MFYIYNINFNFWKFKDNIFISSDVNNKDILTDSHDIQKQIGYLPELNPLYSEMRVYDLLEFTANIRNISSELESFVRNNSLSPGGEIWLAEIPH